MSHSETHLPSFTCELHILVAELSAVVTNRIRKAGRSLLALLLSYSLTPAFAQESLPDPAIYKPANDEEAARLEKAWLHSKDSRLVAWAAYLAGNESRRELIPDLVERTDRNDSLWNSNGAATLVLDALIHLNAQAPVPPQIFSRSIPHRDSLRRCWRPYSPALPLVSWMIGHLRLLVTEAASRVAIGAWRR